MVYPTLYFIKTRLFKKIPKHFDRQILRSYRNDPELSKAFSELETAIQKRGKDLGLSESEIENHEVSFLENLLKVELKDSKGVTLDIFGDDATQRFLAELRKPIASKYKWSVAVANIDSFFSVGIAGQ